MALTSPPPLTPKHIEECLKLVAGGLQNLALLLFGAILLQPTINASLTPPGWLKIIGLLAAGAAEVTAIVLLRYISFTPDPKDRT